MKKQKMSLKELYALAKGKPGSCCETSSTAGATKQKEAADCQCSETKKDNRCC